MKKILFFICLMFYIKSDLIAQTRAYKIHAYFREVSGGAAIEGEKRKATYQYLIYLVAPPSQKPIISSVYIQGRAYDSKTQKVKAPVVFSLENENGKLEKRTLVTATSNNVYQLVISPDDALLPPTKQMKQLISANDVVLSGVSSKGKFVIQVKKMKKLPMLLAE